MGSITTSVISGLLTKAIPGVLCSRVVKDALVGMTSEAAALEAQLSSDVTARLAYESVARRLFQASTTDQSCADLFASEEFEALLRQLLAANAAGKDKSAWAAERLAHLFTIYLPHVQGELKKDLALDLAKALHKTVAIAVASLMEQHIIPPDAWAVAGVRQILADELEAFRIDLSRPIGTKNGDLESLRRFSVDYLTHIGQHCQYLIPPNISEAREIPIERLYVAGTFEKLGTAQVGQKPLSRDELLEGAYRIVVLGNPGGGKSTFARKLCFDLWRNRQEKPFGGREVIPFLVVLRDFARKKNEKSFSILDFLIDRCRADFQMESVPEGAIARLLRTGKALVIFDGLDELLDTADRLTIKQSVEHFCHEYPSTPVLITSRKVGYEQAPLDERLFKIYLLANFTDEQVDEYAWNWFRLNKSENLEEQRKLCTSFIDESKIVSDIRNNPLMLALMCNLYRQDGYIPRNRPDVYARCADLLFVKWDKSRGIKHGLGLEYQIRPAMNYLAYWIYSNDALREGVTEQALVDQLADYLVNQFDSLEEAEQRSKVLVEFCRDRAWVFSDTGSTPECRLYQFTHRTFLEFFAADHLVRKQRSPAELVEQLGPR